MVLRLTIPETPRFTAEIADDETIAAADIEKILAQYGGRPSNEVATLVPQRPSISSVSSRPVAPARTVSLTPHSHLKPKKGGFNDFFKTFLLHPRNLKILIGTSLTWFCLDVAFYKLNLNTSVVISAIGFGKKGSAWDEVWSQVKGSETKFVAALWLIFALFCRHLET